MKTVATQRNRHLRIGHIGDSRTVMFAHAIDRDRIEHGVYWRHFQFEAHGAINGLRAQEMITVSRLRRALPTFHFIAHISAGNQRRVQKRSVTEATVRIGRFRPHQQRWRIDCAASNYEVFCADPHVHVTRVVTSALHGYTINA